MEWGGHAVGWPEAVNLLHLVQNRVAQQGEADLQKGQLIYPGWVQVVSVGAAGISQVREHLLLCMLVGWQERRLMAMLAKSAI